MSEILTDLSSPEKIIGLMNSMINGIGHLNKGKFMFHIPEEKYSILEEYALSTKGRNETFKFNEGALIFNDIPVHTFPGVPSFILGCENIKEMSKEFNNNKNEKL